MSNIQFNNNEKVIIALIIPPFSFVKMNEKFWTWIERRISKVRVKKILSSMKTKEESIKAIKEALKIKGIS